MTKLHSSTLALGLIGTSLLLGACNKLTNPNPTPTQPTAISGTITPFTAGQADQVVQQLTGIKTSLTNTGNFDLPLPSVATVNSSYANLLNSKDETFGFCSTTNVTAPSGFKSLAFTTLFTSKNGALLNEYSAQLPAASGVSYKAWWFANVAGTVTANNTGCIGFGSVNQSLVFKQGWNVFDINVNGNTTTITRAANQTPGRLPWTRTSANVQALSLNPYLFNPWAALHK